MQAVIEAINLIGIPAWLLLAMAAVELSHRATALVSGKPGGPMSQHLARGPMRT